MAACFGAILFKANCARKCSSRSGRREPLAALQGTVLNYFTTSTPPEKMHTKKREGDQYVGRPDLTIQTRRIHSMPINHFGPLMACASASALTALVRRVLFRLLFQAAV